MDRGLDVFREPCGPCGHGAHLRRICYESECDCLAYWPETDRPPSQSIEVEIVAIDGVPVSPAPAPAPAVPLLTERDDPQGELLDFQIERGEDLE